VCSPPAASASPPRSIPRPPAPNPHAQACRNKAGSRDGATQRGKKEEQASPAGVEARPTAHGGSSDPPLGGGGAQSEDVGGARFALLGLGLVAPPASIDLMLTPDGCLFPVSIFTFTLQVFIHTTVQNSKWSSEFRCAGSLPNFTEIGCGS
jgi:hypothetical protein